MSILGSAIVYAETSASEKCVVALTATLAAALVHLLLATPAPLPVAVLALTTVMLALIVIDSKAILGLLYRTKNISEHLLRSLLYLKWESYANALTMACKANFKAY